jgi:ubiquinone biosynthesis monooxygenase Coq7
VLEQMRLDEGRHGAEAIAAGGAVLPAPVKVGMEWTAKVMTTLSYRV